MSRNKASVALRYGDLIEKLEEEKDRLRRRVMRNEVTIQQLRAEVERLSEARPSGTLPSENFVPADDFSAVVEEWHYLSTRQANEAPERIKVNKINGIKSTKTIEPVGRKWKGEAKHEKTNYKTLAKSEFIAIDCQVRKFFKKNSAVAKDLAVAVSVVDAKKNEVLAALVDPTLDDWILEQKHPHSVYKIDEDVWRNTSTLEDVRQTVIEMARDRVVVGHDVWRVLEALELDAEIDLQPKQVVDLRDKFKKRDSAGAFVGCGLEELAYRFCDWIIPTDQLGHDPRTHAKAICKIYRAVKKMEAYDIKHRQTQGTTKYFRSGAGVEHPFCLFAFLDHQQLIGE